MRRWIASLRVARYEVRSLRLSLVVVCVIGAAVSAGMCVDLLLRSHYFAVYGYQPTLADLRRVRHGGDTSAHPLLGGGRGPAYAADTVWMAHPRAAPSRLGAAGLPGRAAVTPRLLPAGTGRPIGFGKCAVALLGCAAIWLCVATPLRPVRAVRAREPRPGRVRRAPRYCRLRPRDDGPAAVRHGRARPCEALLVSCAISLAQLLLSLAVDARLSFVVVAAQFAGSLFVMTPLIPGNLMSAARSLSSFVPYQGRGPAGPDPGRDRSQPGDRDCRRPRRCQHRLRGSSRPSCHSLWRRFEMSYLDYAT